MIKEACVGNLKSALNAQRMGADQIELCERLDLDGNNPSIDLVKIVCNKVKIPIKVIVNPKPFDYIYSKKDIGEIINYVKNLNDLPVQGIVFGPLTKEKLPDLNLIELIAQHTELPITFHKAIDITIDINQSVSLLKKQNIIQYILSSGGAQTAILGIHKLNEMKEQLKGSQINLIAAGKIDNHNLGQIHSRLNLSYYHGKKIVGDLVLNS